ncbi:MAG TPA: hypothetical protein VM577_16800, partial [Anaerovoracaceae bacterium]|nr:hypothetical protein [Anaerovoracaceae bacterium]
MGLLDKMKGIVVARFNKNAHTENWLDKRYITRMIDEDPRNILHARGIFTSQLDGHIYSTQSRTHLYSMRSHTYLSSDEYCEFGHQDGQVKTIKRSDSVPDFPYLTLEEYQEKLYEALRQDPTLINEFIDGDEYFRFHELIQTIPATLPHVDVQNLKLFDFRHDTNRTEKFYSALIDNTSDLKSEDIPYHLLAKEFFALKYYSEYPEQIESCPISPVLNPHFYQTIFEIIERCSLEDHTNPPLRTEDYIKKIAPYFNAKMIEVISPDYQTDAAKVTPEQLIINDRIFEDYTDLNAVVKCSSAIDWDHDDIQTAYLVELFGKDKDGIFQSITSHEFYTDEEPSLSHPLINCRDDTMDWANKYTFQSLYGDIETVRSAPIPYSQHLHDIPDVLENDLGFCEEIV